MRPPNNEDKSCFRQAKLSLTKKTVGPGSGSEGKRSEGKKTPSSGRRDEVELSDRKGERTAKNRAVYSRGRKGMCVGGRGQAGFLPQHLRKVLPLEREAANVTSKKRSKPRLLLEKNAHAGVSDHRNTMHRKRVASTAESVMCSYAGKKIEVMKDFKPAGSQEET